MIDASSSIGAKRFRENIEFVADIIDELNIDNGLSRAGVMTFSDSATIHARLDDYNTREDLKELVRGLRYEGGKAETGRALEIMRTEMYSGRKGDRVDVTDVILLVGDGKSSDDDETIQEAVKAKLAGITIISAPVTDRYEEFLIREIASDPDVYNVFPMSRATNIVDIVTPVRRAMCNGKTILNFK